MNSQTKRVKVVLAKNMLPPYRVEFIRELAKRVELTLVLDTLSEPGRNWQVDLDGLNCETIVLDSPSREFQHQGSAGDFQEARVRQFSWGLWKELKRLSPDCVVSTEFGLRSLLAALWCRLYGGRLIIWWEGTEHTERSKSKKRGVLRKLMSRLATRYWSNGGASERYLSSLGVALAQVDNGMTGIDTAFFEKEASEARALRDDWRRRFGLHGKVVIFSGALNPRKGVRELLAGLEELYRRGWTEPLTLALAGEGEERAIVEAWDRAGGRIEVRMVGFLQVHELPGFYVSGDLFVLPTLEDNWALATLEPLICGVPSLISCYNGAADDLSGPGAAVFDPLDVDSFAEALRSGLEGDLLVTPGRMRELADYYRPAAHGERAAASINAAVAQGEN